MNGSKRVKGVCDHCKKEFTLMPSEAKTRQSKGNVYCSSACFHDHRRKTPKAVTA